MSNVEGIAWHYNNLVFILYQLPICVDAAELKVITHNVGKKKTKKKIPFQISECTKLLPILTSAF